MDFKFGDNNGNLHSNGVAWWKNLYVNNNIMGGEGS